MEPLFRFPGARRHDPAVDSWLRAQPAGLGGIATCWFERMRRCGEDVTELLHDDCPVACVRDAAFAYVNVYSAHVNVGFFLGTRLDDPAGLLEGSGRYMRHVKLRPGREVDQFALLQLIEDACAGMRRLLDQA